MKNTTDTNKERYRIFEVDNTKVQCPVPEERNIKDYKISVVSVGEKGRGRWEEFIPITPSQEPIKYVEIGKTRSGRPRFNKANECTTNENVIVILKLYGGYRGRISYGGKFVGKYKCPQDYYCSKLFDSVTESIEHADKEHPDYEKYTKNNLVEKHKKMLESGNLNEVVFDTYFMHRNELKFYDEKYYFKYTATDEPPLQIFAKGNTAQGAAGQMGISEQRIVLLPKNVVLSWTKHGRTLRCTSCKKVSRKRVRLRRNYNV